MKKINTFAISLIVGLFSTAVFANEVTTQPTTLSTQPPVVTAPAPSTAPASIQQVTADPNSVNINTASAAEIQDKLVGIGGKKAQAIVDYRTKNGAFLSIEQLKEVSGIGAATLEKNRSRIVL